MSTNQNPTSAASSDWADKLASNLCACDIISSRDVERVAKQAREHLLASSPSLQSVAEGAATRIHRGNIQWLEDRATLNIPTLTRMLLDAFAPLLAERDERIGRLEKERDGLLKDLTRIAEGCGVGCPDREEAIRRIVALKEQLGVAQMERDNANRLAQIMAKAADNHKAGETALRTRCEELERDKERLENLFERGEVTLGRSERGDVMLKWRDKWYYGADVSDAVDAARKPANTDEGEGR